MRRRRNNKYNAKKTLGSASRKEYYRLHKLQILLRAGEISDLRCQVPFELIPEQRERPTIGPRGGVRPGKLLERPVKYVADFVYIRDGQKVVEDVKGYRGGQAYALFVIKRKLMLERHGIRIVEV